MRFKVRGSDIGGFIAYLDLRHRGWLCTNIGYPDTVTTMRCRLLDLEKTHPSLNFQLDIYIPKSTETDRVELALVWNLIQ